jgi:hypothetical protein
MRMGKVITIQFRRTKLPRRLLNEGWWLEPDPPQRRVIAFRRPPRPKRERKANHLGLVISKE